MAARVSDMIKMYNQPPPKPTGDKPGAGRKWPPVGGTTANKPPPITPKPKALTPHANGNLPRPTGVGPKPFGKDENLPQWKLDMQRTRADSGGQKQNPAIPLWKQKQLEREEEDKKQKEPKIPPWRQNKMEKEKQEETPKPGNIPLWKQRLNKAQDEDAREENIPPWKQKNENPPKRNSDEIIPAWKKNLQQKESNSKPWSERNKNNFSNGVGVEKSGSVDPPRPPPNKPHYGGNLDIDKSLAPSRNNQQNKSFSSYNTMPKTKIERSSGSVGNTSPRRASPNAEHSDSSIDSQSPQIRSSFLHNAKKPLPSHGYADRVSRTPTPPASEKPRVNGVPRKLPIPREILSIPPPVKTSKPAFVTLPSRGKKKSAPLPPPPIEITTPHMGARPLPSPGSRILPPPPSLGPRDLSFPSDGPPNLPFRDLPPPLPEGRPLPSPVHKSESPLPPPPMEVDDIYDDPGEEPPPVSQYPPALPKRQSSGGMIPTWDDEAEAVYDETADEHRPPVGFPISANPNPPIIPDEGEDMYEDVEEYMRLKRLQVGTSSVTSNESREKDKKEKEKKRKEAEKKDKEIRKKFKIGKGEIVPEGHGTIKETCRGSGKDLAATAGEHIDVIRMTENPKGKWLVRNLEGSYGFVDSDKVAVNLQELRSTFGVASRGPAVGGGPVPPIPTDNEEEAIYDQTAEEEDLYEEL